MVKKYSPVILHIFVFMQQHSHFRDKIWQIMNACLVYLGIFNRLCMFIQKKINKKLKRKNIFKITIIHNYKTKIYSN